MLSTFTILTITIPLLFLLSLGLSILLTYLPCYATLCTEEFFPYETRLHIASFYSILAVAALLLTLRASSPRIRRLSETYLHSSPIPLIDRRLTIGGAIMTVWLIGMHFPTFAFWLPAEVGFYQGRAEEVGWPKKDASSEKLAIVGMVGHACDTLLGLLILPISRGAVLGKLWRLESSTLVFVHKMLGYLLLAATFIHAVPFFVWAPTFAHAPEQFKDTYHIDNPTLSVSEVERRGYWFTAVVPFGLFALVAMLIITVTSLPRFRRTMYNMFYYTHIICSILFFFFTAVHASTDFYFLLPGLVLWIVDWIVRVRWITKNGVEGKLEDAGNGWYRITLPVLSKAVVGKEKKEREREPLQAYYLNFPAVSKLQCHAFTASSVGTDTQGPKFLFRKSEGKKQKKLDKEWTWKLGELVRSSANESEVVSRSTMSLKLRLEGPYITHSPLLSTSNHILCVVGGTGLTGALCIANYWLQYRSSDPTARFSLVWTVRGESTANLKEMQDLVELSKTRSNMNVIIHISGSGAGRLEPLGVLQDCFSATSPTSKAEKHIEKGSETGEQTNKEVKDESGDKQQDQIGWIYCSGPTGLLNATETACVQYRRTLKDIASPADGAVEDGRSGGSVVKEIEWYCARWEV